MGHVTISTPLSGIICRLCAGAITIRQCIKFKISTLTHYEDMKGDKNAEIGVVLGLGVTQGHRQHSHSIKHIMTSYSTLIETMRLGVTFTSGDIVI